MGSLIDRRQMLIGGSAALIATALDGCAPDVLRRPPAAAAAPPLRLPALRATVDRITAITVCTRPFRAEGPRLDAERLGGKTVVHNYGHGGSGWSLSWGSSSIATAKAMATGERDIAVIGCGALGLTSALLLQRAGARVTIYAKELPPNVRSSLATGVWSPDSRICFEQHATPEFKRTWESMARTSHRQYQNLIGLPGAPVEYYENYFVSDRDDPQRDQPPPADTRPAFAKLERELLGDLTPRPLSYEPGSHPFGPRRVQRHSWMMFNLNAYSRLLVADFQANGGRIEVAEFGSPGDLAKLSQRTLINATGYGARALFGDETVTPVRGQLARMIPQPDVNYGLFYKGASFVPRHDGMVFQYVGDGEYYGYGDDTTEPDRTEAERAVYTIARLFT